jgi:hypothetical protein
MFDILFQDEMIEILLKKRETIHNAARADSFP